jgi:pyridoxine kinase
VAKRQIDLQMARVLALSSHVAFGSVGLAVIVPALQGLGHEVIALPTVVLSSHPGYGRFAGEQIAPVNLDQIVDALDANDWLAGTDAVLTGYLPTAAHVSAAGNAIARVRAANPAAVIVCDPICGDEPDGLYLDAEVPDAMAKLLLSQCDVATPNAFELSWFAGVPVATPGDALIAARTLGVPAVLATSIPAGEDRLATLLVGESAARIGVVARRETAPHGTGDLLAALYLGHVLNGMAPEAALGRSLAAVEMSIAMSTGRDELSLTYAGAIWAQAEALPTAAI